MFNFNFDDGMESSVIRKGSLLFAILSDSCSITNEDGTREYLIGNGCRLYSIQIQELSTGDFAVTEFMEMPEGHDGEHTTDMSKLPTEEEEAFEEKFAEIIHVNFNRAT
jgi:hypothetical protein